MRSDSADQKKDRHGYGEHVVPAKIMLYNTTFLWKLGLRPSRWSQKLSRAQLLRFGRGDHQRHPATALQQVAGLSSVIGRCVFGIVNRPLAASYVQGNAKLWLVHISEVGNQPANIRKFMELLATAVGSGNTHEWSRILSLSIK